VQIFSQRTDFEENTDKPLKRRVAETDTWIHIDLSSKVEIPVEYIHQI